MLLKEAGGLLMEPIMSMSINVQSAHVGTVTQDIVGTRGGEIIGIEARDSDGYQSRTIIEARAPLSMLLGYASSLRSMTQGSGEWSMRLFDYGKVQNQE
jgi:elongation factor G